VKSYGKTRKKKEKKKNRKKEKKARKHTVAVKETIYGNHDGKETARQPTTGDYWSKDAAKNTIIQLLGQRINQRQ
jgi:hypothetical protein